MIKLKLVGDREFPFYGIYRYMSFVVVPTILIFLFLEAPLEIELSPIYKSLLIYIFIMMIILSILARVKSFKEYFLIAHYTFLFGVMAINFVWFYIYPTTYDTHVLLMAFNLIGLSTINPKVTIWFNAVSLILYFTIALSANNLDPNLAFLIFSSATVITLFNYWRYGMISELNASKETYQQMFDSSGQQTYVLDEQMKILDMSTAADQYLKDEGVTNAVNKKFNEIFKPQTEQCALNLRSAIQSCREIGSARFNANCSIGHKVDFIPKEFTLRKGKYFDKDVFIMNVRAIKDQKEYEKKLLEQKDNITQILENINYFIFNISFDTENRKAHHVNFVSSKVKEIYGYSTEEYAELVKAEQIDRDMHPEDKDRINVAFDRLIETGQKESWQFRMKIPNKEGWRWMEETVHVKRSDQTSMVSLFGMVKDITDQVEAEEKLKSSEQSYRELFQGNLAGVYKTSLDGTILDCNPAFASILGYESTEEAKQINAKDIYYNEEDRAAYVDKLKKHKKLNNHLTIAKRKDGRRLILNNNVSLVQDDSGEYTTIIGTLVDITDLEETSEALKHSEEKYRLLFEESNNAILLVLFAEDQNYVVDANQTAIDLFETDEDNFIGRQLSELISESEEVQKEIEKLFKDVKAGNRAEAEWEFINAKGKVFPAEVAFASIAVEEENVVQLVIKDISERKQYEREILESRLSFKNIVDKSPASILIFSKTGELMYVNPNGESLFKNVLKAEGHHMYQIFPKEKHALINDLIGEAESEVKSYTEIEFGEEGNKRKYSINVIDTIYNFTKANLFIVLDITLQTEYNIQKLRAEMAEETNERLQQEIERHKRTQQSLVDSTSRLKALFESAANLYIISIDRDFNIVSFNQNFKWLVKTKLNKEVEVGVHFMDIFPIEDYAYDLIVNRFKDVLKGNASNLISTFPSVDGEDVWVESFLSPIQIEGEEIKEISFISHDITEKVENRKKILENEENNRAILLAIPDILFKINREGVFTDYRAHSFLNRRNLAHFVRSDELKNKALKDVFRDIEVADEIMEYVLKTLASEEPLTQNLSLSYLDESGKKETIHYENRYSKVNDDEVVIISRNVSDTVEYEQKLIDSVKEKEVLLKEVHHRVKNNLQVINSILNLQSSYVSDEETLQIIIESQNRIRSMSYIHESLYQTKDFATINFQDYITNLVQNLVHTYEVYSAKTDLEMKVGDVSLALDQAIPCGLILNELITNALKYAYPEKKGGKIVIEVYEKDKKVYVHVQDFGVGLPNDFKMSETDSLGLSLVDTLIDQLDGELQLETKSGTDFLIIFDKQEF